MKFQVSASRADGRGGCGMEIEADTPEQAFYKANENGWLGDYREVTVSRAPTFVGMYGGAVPAPTILLRVTR